MTGIFIFEWNVLLSLLSYERATSEQYHFLLGLIFYCISFYCISSSLYIFHFHLISFYGLSFVPWLSLDLSVCLYLLLQLLPHALILHSCTERLQTPWHLITVLSLSSDTIIILRARESRTWQNKVLTRKYDVLSLKKRSKKTRRACRVTLDWVPIGEFNCWSLCCINAAFERREKMSGDASVATALQRRY